MGYFYFNTPVCQQPCSFFPLSPRRFAVKLPLIFSVILSQHRNFKNKKAIFFNKKNIASSFLVKHFKVNLLCSITFSTKLFSS